MGEGNIPDNADQWANAPIFNFNDDKLKFNTKHIGNANPNYGSASGFLPKLSSDGLCPDFLGVFFILLLH